MWKIILLIVSSIVIVVLGFGFWFISLIDGGIDPAKLSATEYADIPYFNSAVVEKRGKILAVVTSTAVMGNSGKHTGYELTELSRPYAVFTVNGFEVDIASPLGGEPPVVIDRDDMGEYDYAFLNDSTAQAKVKNSIPLETINPKDYHAVFFVGGKGAMFDFPDNGDIQRIVRHLYEADKVIAAVCHGPAALLNVRLSDDTFIVNNYQISAFTNEEELLLIPDAKTIFPFLLQDKLTEQGARFDKGLMYLEKISVDGNILTGQNPWSVWRLAEAMVTSLGYAPILREITAEENSVAILGFYESQGLAFAKQQFRIQYADKPLSRHLIAMHSIVALMQWRVSKAVDLVRLLSSIQPN